MILSYFKPKKSQFWPFFIENWSKILKIRDFCCKKSSKFEEISKINIYFLVPQVDHLVALWEIGQKRRREREIGCRLSTTVWFIYFEFCARFKNNIKFIFLNPIDQFQPCMRYMYVSSRYVRKRNNISLYFVELYP